jgi:hypothetical protein
MPLKVAGTGTILLVGGGETAQGEVWLENDTGGDVKIDRADLSIQVGAVEQHGSIPLPADEGIKHNSYRRLSISLGMEPFTAPGEYVARVDLTTSIGAQSIPALLVVIANAQVAVIAEQPVFTQVVPPTTIATAVVVRNVGNVPVHIDAVPDEPLFDVVAGQRLLGIGAGGVVQVQPASSLVATAHELSFTLGATPTIAPGGWAKIGIDIAVPAGVGTGAHVRALPRIANDRFSIDLVT